MQRMGDSSTKHTMATTRLVTESKHQYSSHIETSGGYTKTECFSSSSGIPKMLPALQQTPNFERFSETRRSVPLISHTEKLSLSPFNRYHNVSNPSISAPNPGSSLRVPRSAMNGVPLGTYPQKNTSKQNGNEDQNEKKSKSILQMFSKSKNKKDDKKNSQTGPATDAKVLTHTNILNNATISIPEDMKKGIIIKVRKTRKMLPDLEDDKSGIPTYETKSKYKRGKVLLINNIDFKRPRYREGADIDHRNIQNLFRNMGFNVIDYKNKSKRDTERLILDYCKNSSLKDVDINITVIMSHGNGTNNTYIETIDNQALELEWVVEQFNSKNCKNLANKPKIFIFQCCRGDASDIQTDTIPFQAPRSAADVLLAFATVPGFVSYRDGKFGTWYIQSICKVFMEDACELDVESLLKKVDENMQKNSNFHRQTSSYENRGFKRCYLNPI